MTQSPLARPEFLPPKDVPPSALVLELIKRGRPPSLLVDFPRFDDMGRPVCKVRLRLLTSGEEGLALANAHRRAAKLLENSADSSALAKPDDLQQNERIVEVLAIACRAVWYECHEHKGARVPMPGPCAKCGAEVVETTANPDGTDAPFFEHGAIEARHYCSGEELGVLALSYAKLKQRTHPRMGELTDAEMREWVEVIAKGLLENPFAYFSRGPLETLCEYAAKSLVEAEARTTGPSPT